ncbi:hypothetical protein B0J12DRAFT_44533 [Macrophomina phaseolina]|uniref:Uncharacterized protein n=1 Tax=Macrophomina phaseolina TaxID=35725 RepID=A0ABQ8GDN8_9PEZI|nr:hypothetical protein B0J12DRAFT_44533 [Macrophomina phaseolina]
MSVISACQSLACAVGRPASEHRRILIKPQTNIPCPPSVRPSVRPSVPPSLPPSLPSPPVRRPSARPFTHCPALPCPHAKPTSRNRIIRVRSCASVYASMCACARACVFVCTHIPNFTVPVRPMGCPLRFPSRTREMSLALLRREKKDPKNNRRTMGWGLEHGAFETKNSMNG